MKQDYNTEQDLYYYNCLDNSAIYKFCKQLFGLIETKMEEKQNIVILCIGSDRATGDCLGPIIGYKLEKLQYKNLAIYGTLNKPVHAKNLQDTLSIIYERYRDPFIIAIDASLGKDKHVGYVTLAEGSLKPGIGVDKELPQVGDICITGIVNVTGYLNHMLLQTTRLDTVMQLADFICVGLRYVLRQQQSLPLTMTSR
ncbi:MAG: spore protease YyaC [bacterium]|nr:spore protease YyaC [bacterium]